MLWLEREWLIAFYLGFSNVFLRFIRTQIIANRHKCITITTYLSVCINKLYHEMKNTNKRALSVRCVAMSERLYIDQCRTSLDGFEAVAWRHHEEDFFWNQIEKWLLIHKGTLCRAPSDGWYFFNRRRKEKNIGNSPGVFQKFVMNSK